MNAKARTAQQIVKARRLAAKAEKSSHTLRGHVLRAGIADEISSGVAGALRTKAKQVGVAGCKVRMFRTNAAGQKIWRQPVAGARRFTRQEVALIAHAYKPRAAKYVAARELLLTY